MEDERRVSSCRQRLGRLHHDAADERAPHDVSLTHAYMEDGHLLSPEDGCDNDLLGHDICCATDSEALLTSQHVSCRQQAADLAQFTEDKRQTVKSQSTEDLPQDSTDDVSTSCRGAQQRGGRGDDEESLQTVALSPDKKDVVQACMKSHEEHMAKVGTRDMRCSTDADSESVPEKLAGCADVSCSEHELKTEGASSVASVSPGVSQPLDDDSVAASSYSEASSDAEETNHRDDTLHGEDELSNGDACERRAHDDVSRDMLPDDERAATTAASTQRRSRIRADKKPHGCIRILGYVSLVALLMIGAFAGGLYLGTSNNMLLKAQQMLHGASGGEPSTDAERGQYEMHNRIENLTQTLSDQALNPLSTEQTTEAALRGITGALSDKYAEYYNPDEYQAFLRHTNGSFKGIGVVLGGTKDQYVAVVRVFPGTPAERGGLKPGDIIMSINGGERPQAADEVSKQISGATTESIEIRWIRPSESSASQDGSALQGTSMSATFVPEKIEVPVVASAIKGDVGIISISQFTETTNNQVKEALKSLDEQGATCYVLDLRNNPGGLLQQAIDITSLFVKEGTVVQVQSRAAANEVRKVTGDWYTDKPLAVIINGNSASASEVMAAALKDHQRATIVGTTSFGKGSVQVVQPLGHDDAVKFTIAHYTSPNNTTIDGVGVVPDVTVGDANSQAFYELTSHMLANDSQMRAAFEALGRPGVD